MKRLLFFLLSLGGVLSAQSDPAAYGLFRQGGKPVKFKKMMKDLEQADVILFGELHNNPIAHWLQLELAGELEFVDLGLEMFETDQQAALDSFLRGELDGKALQQIEGGIWPNFRTDYEPIVKSVNEKGTVIATNVPRKYARLVFRQGLSALDTLVKVQPETAALLPPLPLAYDPELPGYKAMLEMMPGGHGGETFPMAQAVKDATMAYRITQTRSDGRRYLHLNGSYHSDDFEGIYWYLNQYSPGLKIVTITTVEQERVNELNKETRNKADYILAVPTFMTKTY